MKIAIAGLIMLAVSQCSTTGPKTIDGLKGALGDDLGRAHGKTLADQSKIDRNMARGCSIGVCSTAACDRHTKASAARRAELRI